MGDELITYERLYEILRQEKYQEALQSLDKDFFQQVISYLHEKESILKNQQEQNSIFAKGEVEKTKKQVENVYKIIRDIYDKREGKIIQLALLSARDIKNILGSSSLLEEEEEFFKRCSSLFTQFRGDILSSLLEGKKPHLRHDTDLLQEAKYNEKKQMVRFLEAVPQFLDTEMNKHGPFEEEEIAHLPLKISELLIKKQKAEAL